MPYARERLGRGLTLLVSPEHTFGTDAFLLADFAAPKQRERAVDLGSGCGIVAALLLCAPTPPQRVDCVEIQPQAVEQMRLSVEENGLQERMIPHLSDLCDLSGVLPAGAYDLVTCNPPYKAANSGILSGSESEKIARHEVLCTMDDVADSAARLLRYGGRFCLCQRPERLADVICAMRRAGVEPKRLRFVQKTSQSAPWLFLLEGRRGGKPSFLQVLPPLLITGAGGAPSQELREIYERLDCGYGR